MKKIAFGSTLLNRGLSGSGIDGIGQYCQELLTQYEIDNQDFEIMPFAFEDKPQIPNEKVFSSYTAHAIKSLLHLNISERHFFQKTSLIHATDQLIPIVKNVPILATVMDAIPLSKPEFIKPSSRLIKPLIWKTLTRRANHICTISEFSKQEIIEYLNYPGDAISVIPLGVDSRFFKPISSDNRKSVLNKFNIPSNFILTIGSIQPRKNLARLIAAHANLPNSIKNDIPLVIVGRFWWDDAELKHQIQEGIQNGRCICINYVSDLEKRCLLQSAQALAFTSLFEGFGLPILEAYASKLPVITSTSSSMPEVANGSSVLVDPTNIEEINEALKKILQTDKGSNPLVASGFAHAKSLSWEATAKKTIALYKKLT